MIMMVGRVVIIRRPILIQQFLLRIEHHHRSLAEANQFHHLRRHSPLLCHVTASPRPRPFLTVSSSSLSPTPIQRRHLHFRSRAAAANSIAYGKSNDSNSDSDSDSSKKSRNEKKREARRAVRWGMDLASFSTPQINRILRVASQEPEVLEAIMIVKRLGRDVREGKRRQYNYIGRLLREAEPELMDGLIQATKDGDQSKFQALAGPETSISGDDNDDEFEEIDSSDEEGSNDYIDTVTRWFQGLINKDVDINKEIYSLQDVDFDRQELRRLVRQVHTMRERQIGLEDNGEGAVDKAINGAERSLSRFLQTLAKQLSS